MKGTVVVTWLNSIKSLYGENVLSKALSKNSWAQERVINPLEDIEDNSIFEIINTVGQIVNKPTELVWKEIGKTNIESFQKWFPSYFERYSLKSFLIVMDEVHAQLTKMIPGAKPPRLIATEISPNEIELKYSSKRGLYDYFLGLLEGSAEFFKEKLTYDIIEKSVEENNKTLRVRIKFEKQNEYVKNFALSKIASFGFIKNIPLKVTILNTFIITLVSYFLTKNILHTSVIGAGTLLSTFALTYIIFKPINSITDEINRLKNLDFTDNYSIKTGDSFEGLSQDIRLFKQDVTKDFLFLKGGSDDLHSFTVTFAEIAKKMEYVSDGIANLVQEVANGAVHQAEETEKSVYILSADIEELNNIAREQNEGKERLIEAVNYIEESLEHTDSVAKMVLGVKDSFANVNKQGEELAKEIENILGIVTTVASVADQTNLLALNAAIEAARAGEMGKGFAVVADEIRKLAENSKSAVRSINVNLNKFTDNVNELVSQISSQFNQLEESNRTLEDVLVGNRESTTKISDVADNIATLIGKLSNEAQQLSGVYENIHSLAAIAEENSASSEEMSANVSEYSDRIKELTNHIQMLERLTDNYKTELKKYKI